MGTTIKHTKEDVIRFKSEVCNKCHCLNACESTFSDMTVHIPICPKFFNYMIGYKSFIQEQVEWEREHPEEAEARYRRNLKLSRQIKSQRRTKKNVQD